MIDIEESDTRLLDLCFQASLSIQLHVFAAIGAFALGSVQIVAPKGTLPHRVIGSIWIALMAAVCVTAFFIHQLRVWGPWSPIHLPAIFTLAGLPVAVWRAHKHDVVRNRRATLGLFEFLLLARLGPSHTLTSCRLIEVKRTRYARQELFRV